VPAVRQLLPEPAEVIDPVAAHAAAARPRPADRPWVALNMVASVDGATAVDGVSGGLGGPADKAVFRALRGVADWILVAAGTVRSERYGPPKTPPELQAARVDRGQSALPRIAIVSRSLDLDPDLPIFADGAPRPLLLTTADAPDAQVERLRPLADVEVVGAESVEPGAALAVLAGHGAATVLCEGGPSLNGQLIAAGVVDELNVTFSPLLVGGPSERVARGPQAAGLDLELAHLWQDGAVLLARYVRAGA
jgi:5-amino-6-(5-phosphoribosylamino)uracil reductase